jgi:putative redox protein
MADTQRFDFWNDSGHVLSGRPDLPEGGPATFALIAHCFACGKDNRASIRLAQVLARANIAALRPDFEGLGASKRDFSSAGFASNIDDLCAAADALRHRYAAPSLLVGHSLGGAAALAAAHRIPEIAGVVTIAARSEPAHVLKNFPQFILALQENGAAEVQLAGRKYLIERKFVDDLQGHHLRRHLAELAVSVLVLYSPAESVVGLENASVIFRYARHLKNFSALDRADHLLSRKQDVDYVAAMSAACFSHYCRESPNARPNSAGMS